MALRDMPEVSIQDDDTQIDLLSKIAMASTSQRSKMILDGVNNTGVKLSGVVFLDDGMSITTATCPNLEGSIDGQSVKAGTFLPIVFTQIQVSGGNAIGFVYGT